MFKENIFQIIKPCANGMAYNVLCFYTNLLFLEFEFSLRINGIRTQHFFNAK